MRVWEIKAVSMELLTPVVLTASLKATPLARHTHPPAITGALCLQLASVSFIVPRIDAGGNVGVEPSGGGTATCQLPGWIDALRGRVALLEVAGVPLLSPPLSQHPPLPTLPGPFQATLGCARGGKAWTCPWRVNDARSLKLGFTHKVGKQWKNTQAGQQLLATVYERTHLCRAGAGGSWGLRVRLLVVISLKKKIKVTK